MSAVQPTQALESRAAAPDPAEPGAASLDAPLPAEVAGRYHGWFTRYRRFPVFSRAWMRHRLQVFGGMTLLVVLALSASLLGLPAGELPVGGLVHVSVQLALPVLLGPWLAWQVRRRDWPERREDRALLAVMAGLVLAMFAFHLWAAEPMKQAVARQLGQLDEQGQRKRVTVSFGMIVSSGEEPRRAETGATKGELAPIYRLTNAVSSALLTLLLGGAAGLPARRRERAALAALAREQALARAIALRHEAEMRLSVLAAQVEPHFLFNTLAGVRSAIATDPGRASEMIDRLVDYLRAAIPRLRTEGAVANATLGAQVEVVAAYLGLMAARMPRLRWSISVDAELMELPCPPLMLISLAENAVKHGAEPKPGAVRIELRARRESDVLWIELADDGAGFGGNAGGTGLGLANIRQRLAQMFGGRASLTLRAGGAGGVVATLGLPLTAEADARAPGPARLVAAASLDAGSATRP